MIVEFLYVCFLISYIRQQAVQQRQKDCTRPAGSALSITRLSHELANRYF